MSSAPMVYLGSPYWHTDQAVRLRRSFIAESAVLWLIKQGLYVYGPLSHSANLAEDVANLDVGGEQYWREHGANMVPRCSALVVLTLRGWRKSKGLKGEMDAAHEHGIPCLYLASFADAFVWAPCTAPLARRTLGLSA